MDPLRAAAFGDRPGADVWEAAAGGSPRERWLAAVVLGAQGRYAAAATVLTALIGSGDGLFASLAASTFASHRRQLGAHGPARRLDALALATAPPAPAPSTGTAQGGPPIETARSAAMRTADTPGAPPWEGPPGVRVVPATRSAGRRSAPPTQPGEDPSPTRPAATGVARSGGDVPATGHGRPAGWEHAEPVPAAGPAREDPGPSADARPSADRGAAGGAGQSADLGWNADPGPSADPGMSADPGRTGDPGPAERGRAGGPGLSAGAGWSGDPDGVDAAGALADALLGLAADALGAGRLVEARRLHARVAPTSWRTAVRVHWVAAELALASGRPEAAVGPAEAAVRLAGAAGGTRHLLKSRLVLGTALVVWGTPESVERGIDILRCDLNHTHRHGLLSLSWPMAYVLLTSPVVRNPAETTSVRNAVVNALSCTLRRADPIGRQLAANSPWIPTALLRSGEPPNADPQTNFLTD
ncbi:hypothetical protein [Saccharothrix obliqua]|uniref:hypothetical protein n=1 Tax=Saccharothrix obliqua TaxID=2861747 RepID=UPI002150AAF3